MKISEVRLTDYGPYAGENRIDLHTTDGRPIVLFGGQNGSGKTTLFEAIQICLHGRSAFESAISQSEYESRLRSLLHESDGEKSTEASVRLEFEYADFGETERYTVERSFRDRGKSVVESLDVRRNGSKLTELEEDQWQDFLKELIPPGISQLFFFDGEKVEALAEAVEDDDHFRDSLMSLLGLDLVERLDTDLKIYRSQKLDQEGYKELSNEIEAVSERKEAVEAEQEEVGSKRDKKQERIAELEAEIDRMEQELAEEGGTFAERRDEYKEERTRLKTEIDTLRDKIREVVTGRYPFALTPDLCREVVDRLEAETEAAQREAARTEAVEALDELADDNSVWEGVSVSEDESGEIVSNLQSALDDQLAPPERPEYELSSEFSQREQQEMQTVVDHALTDLPMELKTLTDQLEQKTRRLQAVEEKISNAPDESVIAPLLGEINELNSELGRLRQEVESHEERLEELETKHGRLESELNNKLDRQSELEDVSDRSQLAADVQEAVQTYSDRLVREKLDRLESVLTDRYLKLSNKEGFYERVVVDEDDLSVAIETTGGTRKEQSQLSAGERQIFATALLWALADISGRPLPFVVDTPLGRLDTEHRSKLVENFFPEASHQVLLFSTDTEITEQYREALADDIAAEFHLQNNDEDGRTEILEGYFGVDADDAVQETTRVGSEPSSSPKQADIEGYSDD
jgi:DNA sulfur modification protein DndD